MAIETQELDVSQQDGQAAAVDYPKRSGRPASPPGRTRR